MKILIACEESQAVCKEMRNRGHDAYSCDIQDCSGGHPEWHLKRHLEEIISNDWDMIIAFPPCTHLAVSGAAHFDKKRENGQQQYAIHFFMMIANAHCQKICIENPIGIMSTEYRKPDQIIHPYYFGDPVPKSTCLWLKNLPMLKHFSNDDLFDKKTHVDPEYIEYNSAKTKSGKSQYSVFGKLGKGKGKERSITFPGIARAMANQWG